MIAKNRSRLTNNLDEAKDDLTEWGYCLLADVITPGQCRRLKERLIEQAAIECEKGVAYLADGQGAPRRIGAPPDRGESAWQAVTTMLNKGRAFVDLAMNPRLHEIAGHLFQGNPFDLHTMRGLIQRSGASAGALHVDQVQLPFTTPMPMMVNAMITLSDFTVENGCTRAIPGSHRMQPPHLGGTFDSAQEVALEAPPGSAIVWESRTCHRSGATRTAEPRYSIATVFNLSFIRQQDVYSASMHDDVYSGLSDGEREMVGFRGATGFNCIHPRFPGDRSNPVGATTVSSPYIPELRRATSPST
jgi:hypothetical protein